MDKWARILGVVVLVAVAWIGFYWWMKPEPPISFDTGPATAVAKAPPPQPQAKPVLVDIPKPLKKQPLALPPTPDTHPAVERPPIYVVEPPKTPAPQAAPVVVPPQFSDYKVRTGDTLASIATMELGNSKFVDAIRRANPFKDMDKLKVGDVIRIPQDPTNIQGRPSPTAPAPQAPVDKREEMAEYTVKAGDTLSKIAKDQYGSAGYVEVILLANKDRLPRGADSLKPGQKLRIPPKQK